jgi:hypothetical protein
MKVQWLIGAALATVLVSGCASSAPDTATTTGTGGIPLGSIIVPTSPTSATTTTHRPTTTTIPTTTTSTIAPPTTAKPTTTRGPTTSTSTTTTTKRTFPVECNKVSGPGGGKVTVEILNGDADVDCEFAQDLLDTYYNHPPRPPQGNGGYVTIDDWECNSSSTQESGRLSTCRGPDSGLVIARR